MKIKLSWNSFDTIFNKWLHWYKSKDGKLFPKLKAFQVRASKTFGLLDIDQITKRWIIPIRFEHFRSPVPSDIVFHNI